MTSQPESLGFIITRHVNNERSNQVWIQCIKKIRKFYPTIPIVIIDDNSNYDYVQNEDDELLQNCVVIQSEYKARGELLPYYYYYHNKWFDKAIFIHDSVFINTVIPTDDVDTIRFLWDFPSDMMDELEEMILAGELLHHLNYHEELVDYFYNQREAWRGCYGVMSVMKHDYVIHLADKYNLFVLLEYIQTRTGRMALERMMGLICCHDNPELLSYPSIYGDYTNNKNYKLEEYLAMDSTNRIPPGINKLFFGR